MTDSRRSLLATGSTDWVSILIYMALVLIGWVNIYASIYNPEHPSIFDMSQRYGMQLVWIGIAAAMAVILLLIDSKFYHILAYPAYWIGIAVLAATLVFGREINGAKAWIFIGSNAIQPVEFAKFSTALAVARYMSKYGFRIDNLREMIPLIGLILLPMAIIVLQNDTGSALVYGAFLIVMYREGLNWWVCLAVFLSIVLFIGSLVLEPATVLVIYILFLAILAGILTGKWRNILIFISALALAVLSVFFGLTFVFSEEMSMYVSLLICSGISVIFTALYAFRKRLRSIFIIIYFFIGGVFFTAGTDYVFDEVLQTHQQKRIMHLLGLESDPQNWGYNVNQSEIAIGSGGLTGKGFLNGTQTRYDFVPYQSTDFIFSTLGEEWGFVGTTVVLALFCWLILRLFRMGERQSEAFGRIYCYSVASIFLIHVVINVGMTIGIMPVIGIPLPFFSYGGSSFLAFTLLFFVAVRLDAGKKESMSHHIRIL